MRWQKTILQGWHFMAEALGRPETGLCRSLEVENLKCEGWFKEPHDQAKNPITALEKATLPPAVLLLPSLISPVPPS